MNPRNTVTETGRRNTGSKSLFIGTMILVACFTAKGAELRVVSGTSAAEPVQFAATELCKYFGEATGLFPETQTVASLANENVLILTQSDMEEMDLRHPADDDEDAYRIYSTGNGALAFAGRSPRAVLYAVYDFLENELGYRWYFPYPEDKVTPRLSSEALNALLAKQMDREATPAFSFREREFRDVMPLNEQTDTRIVQQIDWWAKLRMNRFLLNFGYALDEGLWKRWKATLIPEIKKRGLLLGLGEHGSYPLFLPPARYARNHPEWYCEIDGRRVPGFQIPDGGWAQFCTSNPDAVNAYLNNFAAFIGANPEVDFYYPAPNDVSKWCECALCRDVSIADRYMRLDNQIAVMFERVKPGTRIMHLAYANHRLPPENTLPHPMIDVDIACWGRDLAYPLCDPRTMPEDADYLDVFRQWKEICGRVPGSTQPRVLYHCKLMRHYWLGLHLMPLAVIDDDFACAQDLGLDGFDFPLGFVGIWTKALNTYVVANKCWDPATPARTWTDRFFIDCYGDDANTLQQVYALTEDAFSDLRYGASRTLAWHPATLAVRENQIEGLGANARNAVAKLHEALGIVDGLTGANAEVAARLAKLSKVIRRARDEQEVLVKLDALMGANQVLQARDEGDAREMARRHAVEAWAETKAAAQALAGSYSIEDDMDGLYWAGASHVEIERALEAWGEVIEPYAWQSIGGWETADFEDANVSTLKKIDISEYLVAISPSNFALRFKYASGELGVTVHAVSLWEVTPDGETTRLSEDRHHGFAGYVHENVTYHIDAPPLSNPGSQWLLEIELEAISSKVAVAARGCNGDIFLGLPESTKRESKVPAG